MATIRDYFANIKKTRGFTLVELVIVIVIVGILSIIAVPTYQKHVRRAMSSEGQALLGNIANMQRIYYAKYGIYYHDPAYRTVNNAADFEFNASENKYFRSVYITANNAIAPQSYTAYTTGAGDARNIRVTLTQRKGSTPTITPTGL